MKPALPPVQKTFAAEGFPLGGHACLIYTS